MSTKCSIAYEELKAENGLFASCHIYTDCFDMDGDVFITVWNQGGGSSKTTEETIVVRHDVWDKIVEALKDK